MQTSTIIYLEMNSVKMQTSTIIYLEMNSVKMQTSAIIYLKNEFYYINHLEIPPLKMG